MKTSTWVKIVVAMALLGLGVYALQDRLKPIAHVQPVRRGIAVRSVPGTVETRAALEMELRSDLPGRVNATYLEQGMRVKAGETLIELDPRDVQLELERLAIETEATRKAREMGSSRKFNLADAETALANAQRLLAEGKLSQTEVDSAARRVEEIEETIDRELNQMDTRLAQLDNERKALERKMEKMTIVSPIDGIVARIYAHPGDLIDSGTSIAKIISLDRIVDVKVSEENFAGLEVGQLARVKFLGYGNRTFSGKVSLLLPVADPETQRYTARLELDADRELLFPGLTGEATITIEERPEALIAPAAAVVGDSVFVVEDGIVSVRKIEKGFGSLSSVEALSGLREGDLLIVERLEMFREGDSVRPRIKE